MVVWGLGRGECESLFIWSVTERPTELGRKENPAKSPKSNIPTYVTFNRRHF